MKNLLTWFLCISGFMSLSGQIINRDFNEDPEPKNWSFSLTPYALLASQSANVGGKRNTRSFGELSSLTDAGFQLIAALRYKRFGITMDGTWARLGTNAEQGPLQVDLKVEQRIVDLRASHFVDQSVQREDNRVVDGWSFEMLAGAKYWSHNLGWDYTMFLGQTPIATGNIEEAQSWWGLMLGVKTTISLAHRVLLRSWISFGGFGIGESPDFAYDYTYLNGFRVSRLRTIHAGFRNFRYQRTDGDSEAELERRVNV